MNKMEKERVSLYIRSDIMEAVREAWPGQISRKCEEALLYALNQKDKFVAHCVGCGELSEWRREGGVARCLRCGREVVLGG